LVSGCQLDMHLYKEEMSSKPEVLASDERTLATYQPATARKVPSD